MQLDDIRGRATLTIPEVASTIGLSVDLAYAAARRGEIPTLKFGRRLVVPVPALLRLLGAETTEAPGRGAPDKRGIANDSGTG